MTIPEWSFQEPIENKIEKIYNPKTSKQIVRDNIRLDDRQLKKEVAKEMLNPYYFADRNLKVGSKINLDSHINHAKSKLTSTPNYPEFGIEVRFKNKILNELSVIYARLIYKNKFKYQTFFSSRFDKQDENNKVLDETELFINLNIEHNFTESDLDKIDIKSPLEHQIQQQKMKDSGWRFDKINSMTVYFYKTGELKGSNYDKNRLRSSAILNIENNDKYCFILSLIASPHPCNKNRPNRVTNYKQHFNEVNVQDFDFINGFKCSDVDKFNQLNNLSINLFELNFHQDQNKWRHKLIPIEISKNGSDRVIKLAIYKNHSILIKKLDIFLGDHNKKFICRQGLSSYTSENMLMKHKQKCGEDNITTLKTSNESHLHWKNHFRRNPL